MTQKDTLIGIDLGGTNIRAGKVKDGVLIEDKQTPTPKQPKDAEETIQALIGLVREVFDEEVAAIGIGVPSVVDREKGIVYNVVNIPFWDEVPLKDILEKEFSVPVFIDNDANCFGIGERYFGVGRDYQNFVGLTIGTGLGGVIIQHGKLFKDANCGSGEFGMMPYNGQILEYYASGSYFMNVWGVDGKEMYNRAMAKDPEALEAYNQLGFYLAEAVKIVMYAVDPEMIVFGGSVAAVHPLFEESLRENLKDFAYPNSVKKLKIYFSTLKNAGLLGAAALPLGQK